MKRILVTLALILVTLVIFANHVGNAIPVTVDESIKMPAVYIEKTENSHRQIILKGSSYNRGFEFAKYTKKVILMEEELMTSKLDHFIGNSFIQKTFFTMMMLWFHDVDSFVDQDSLEEMQGVAHWAPNKYEYLASNFTRQIAYHGMHEVGQMFVDEDRVDMGCFVSAIQSPTKHWVIGRNFDFDIDGLFDREKILKWVFPEKGYAFLSVIWPGMVGVVSGVNVHGLYASVNAAGSDDFARVGTPTTIVVKKILNTTKTLDEAIELIKNSQVFITEIFVLGDVEKNRVVVVEKSPARFSVKILNKSNVIANHLEGKIWDNDKTNLKRKVELTSELRKKRGLELIKQEIYADPVAHTAMILRDRNLLEGKKSHLGNRGAIDSFIASQSLIFDMENNIFYVNLGPGTTGKFIGYDLKKSFEKQYPVVAKELPAVGPSQADYDHWQSSMQKVTSAKAELNKGHCENVATVLTLLNRENFIHYDKLRLQGDYASKCLKDENAAKLAWTEALSYYPPYEKQRKYLEEKIK
jgi:isopenicillin-N N-acyltransferase-like protein